jgi:hypothetical protein
MTFRGYWELLGVVRKAKKESYQKTAGMLLPGDAPRIVGVVLAWLLVVAVWVAGNWSRIRDCIGLI